MIAFPFLLLLLAAPIAAVHTTKTTKTTNNRVVRTGYLRPRSLASERQEAVASSPDGDVGSFNSELKSRRLNSGVCFDNRCQDDSSYQTAYGLSCDDVFKLVNDSESQDCLSQWFVAGGPISHEELTEEDLFDLIVACPCACNVDCGATYSPTMSPAPSVSHSSSPSASPTSSPTDAPTSSPTFAPPTINHAPTITPTTSLENNLKVSGLKKDTKGEKDVGGNIFGGGGDGPSTTAAVIIIIIAAVVGLLFVVRLHKRVKKCIFVEDDDDEESSPKHHHTKSQSAVVSPKSILPKSKMKRSVSFSNNPIVHNLSIDSSPSDRSSSSHQEEFESYLNSESSYTASDGDSLRSLDNDFQAYMRWKKERATRERSGSGDVKE